MERRLGRGLGSLLGTAEQDNPGFEVELQRIRPNPFQPRRSMDPAGLEELRDSIQNHGILQPVVLRRQGADYELISGERRWRAARLAGLDRIPAVVRDAVTDDEMLELALVENVQRRDLDPLERARGFQAMLEKLGVTQEDVALKVGLKRSTVANHLRLLELPEKVQEAVGRGLITMGHARALLGLKDPQHQTALLEEVVRRELSVREVERQVRDALQPPSPTTPSAKSAVPPRIVPPWVTTLQRRIEDRLGCPVSIQNGEGFRGRLVLEYHDRAELDRILAVLAPSESL